MNIIILLLLHFLCFLVYLIDWVIINGCLNKYILNEILIMHIFGKVSYNIQLNIFPYFSLIWLSYKSQVQISKK